MVDMNSNLDEQINKAVKFNFGEDYVSHKFETFEPRGNQSSPLKKILELDILNTNLFFYSRKNRTGKTTFMSMLYRKIIEKYGFGHTWVIDDSELQSECRESWLSNDYEYLKQYCAKYQFFIFKDFAKARIEDNRIQPFLFDMMDYLFSNKKRVYFATNYTTKAIADFRGYNWLDIATRIDEKCLKIEI